MRAMNLYLAATFAVVALLFVGTAVLTGMASTWLMALVAAALAVAHRALMARSDAGSNDNARRAFADRETAADRERLVEDAAELLSVETTLINMKCDLAQAVDRRRLLETLAQLTIAGVGEAEAAENGSDERYTLADANRDMF